MRLRLQWPVYRVYGDDYGDAIGIWFRWPVYRKFTFNDVISLQNDLDLELLSRYERAHSEVMKKYADITGLNIMWPDVTPRDLYSDKSDFEKYGTARAEAYVECSRCFCPVTAGNYEHGPGLCSPPS